MGPLQLIFVLETSDEHRTDAVYLNSVLKHFYINKTKDDLCDVGINVIPMDGKRNYKKKKIVDRINNSIKTFRQYAEGETAVIYCLDTDSVEQVYLIGSFFKNVQDFCKEHGFELVWFCKNTENVFLKVEPDTLKNKTDAAIGFAQNPVFEENKLSQKTIKLGCSNILLVLDRYLRRKD